MVFFVLASCANSSAAHPDAANSPTSEGSSALFCRGWDEASRTIIDTINGEENRLEWYESARALDQAMEEYGGHAPLDIRGEWATAYGVYTDLSDLRFTTGGATRAEHVTMVFGSAGAEPVLAEALSAIAVIDEWALTECGDFCSRWSTLKQLIVDDPYAPRWDGDEDQVRRQFDNTRKMLQVGYRLVPEDLEVHWTRVADITLAILDMYEEYDMQLPPPSPNEEHDDVAVEWLGMRSDRVHEVSALASETIEAWVVDNCDSQPVVGGAPGSLFLRYLPFDHLSGRTVFAVLLGADVQFESVASADQYVGVSCGQLFESVNQLEEHFAGLERQARESDLAFEDLVADQWHWGESLRALRPMGEYYESICGRVRHESDLVLDGGEYELFVGTYIGDPGSYGLYLGAPEYCAQVTINVDGDTIVNVPELERCTILPRGDPAEIVRREVAPVEAGGTLSVELESPIAPEEFEGCGLTAVLLPSGATLNDVGRGDLWPVGGFHTGLWNAASIEESVEPGVSIKVGRIPIMSPGPTGGMVELNMQPDERDGRWDTSFPAPLGLATGTYDLRLSAECHISEHSEGEEENRRCATLLGVAIDGETVVEMPPLGVCP